MKIWDSAIVDFPQPWLMEELVEDLQDTAADLGACYQKDPGGDRRSTEIAEARFEKVSAALEYGINLFYEAVDID